MTELTGTLLVPKSQLSGCCVRDRDPGVVGPGSTFPG